MSTTKKRWLVCDNDHFPISDDAGNILFFTASEEASAAAAERAKDSAEVHYIYELVRMAEPPAAPAKITDVE